MLNDRQAARVGRGLANYHRVQTLRLLAKKPDISVGQLARQLKLSQPSVTDHLKKLIDAGLLTSQRQATRSLIQLTERGKAALEFLNTLA